MVPIIYFFEKLIIFIFRQKTGVFSKINGHDKSNKDNKLVIHYILNIDKFKHTKMRSKLSSYLSCYWMLCPEEPVYVLVCFHVIDNIRPTIMCAANFA